MLPLPLHLLLLVKSHGDNRNLNGQQKMQELKSYKHLQINSSSSFSLKRMKLTGKMGEISVFFWSANILQRLKKDHQVILNPIFCSSDAPQIIYN